MSALTLRGDHALLTVRLTPNAKAERIDGQQTLADGKAVLTVKVRAIPEDGAANTALEALIAKAAGVAKSRVEVIAGKTQRVKILRIDGDAAAIAEKLGIG